MGLGGNQGWNEPNKWAKLNEKRRCGVVGVDVKLPCGILEEKRKVDIFIRVRDPCLNFRYTRGKVDIFIWARAMFSRYRQEATDGKDGNKSDTRIPIRTIATVR